MSISPPPVPFDAAVDHARSLSTIEALARSMRQGDRKQGNMLRQLQRLALIEQTLRTLAADGESPRANINGTQETDLFPSYRSFIEHFERDNNGRMKPETYSVQGWGIHLIVQDLAAVWNGTAFEGDGSCTLNKAHERGNFNYPQRALILHSSKDLWGRVGDRNVYGRWFIPHTQYFRFLLEPGDYVVGELYTEIC